MNYTRITAIIVNYSQIFHVLSFINAKQRENYIYNRIIDYTFLWINSFNINSFIKFPFSPHQDWKLLGILIHFWTYITFFSFVYYSFYSKSSVNKCFILWALFYANRKSVLNSNCDSNVHTSFNSTDSLIISVIGLCVQINVIDTQNRIKNWSLINLSRLIPVPSIISALDSEGPQKCSY